MRSRASVPSDLKPALLPRVGPAQTAVQALLPPSLWGRVGGGGSCGTTSPPLPTPTPDPSPAEPRYSEGSATQQSDRSRQQPTSVGGGEDFAAPSSLHLPPMRRIPVVSATASLRCVLSALPAVAERLVSSLSSHIVQITSNVTGVELTLFGTVENDQATVPHNGAYDIVVTVTGPRQSVVARRKE